MNEEKKVKLLAGGLVVFLLGMGSSWYVFRSPAPNPVVTVDNAPKVRGNRSMPSVKEETRNRRGINVREREQPSRTKRDARKKEDRGPRRRRTFDRQREKAKDLEKKRGC